MKIIIYCVLSLLVLGADLCYASPESDYWGKSTIKQPTHYVFSYGISVYRDSSASQDLKDKSNYTPIPVRVSEKFGYVRGWNYISSYGKTALGLVQAKQGLNKTINGIIMPVQDDADFPNNAASHYGFHIVEISADFVEAAGWQGLPKNAKYWTYVVDKEYEGVSDKSHPITQSYLDRTMQGFLDYGPEFAKEFLQTTSGWSKLWLNDRVMARNPWFSEEKRYDFNAIDTLLEDYFKQQSDVNYFTYRKFSEEYK